MAAIKLIRHAPGAPGLRLFGLGPSFIPLHGLEKLRLLLDKNAFWAVGRSPKELKIALAKSDVAISLWKGKRIVGFGRATSDGIYRAVLWDVVIAEDLQGIGLGKKLVNALLKSSLIKNVEYVYIMTTNCSDFYKDMGFESVKEKSLLLKKNR